MSASICIEADPLAALLPHATTTRARPNQQITLEEGPAEAIFVRTGLLVLRIELPDKRRQILNLLYPRDIFRTSFSPPLPEAALAAAVASEIWRIPSNTFETLPNSDPCLGALLSRQLAAQQSRANLHVAAIGSLNGEERVASFLIELALRIGSTSPDGIFFQIPLSRTDIADYLALNADTLSRIMSRLKARGIVVQKTRGRVLVPDGKILRDLSPIADALVALHGSEASTQAQHFSALA
ncbi:MAG: Crp/Fnr family transcriptional regulator [Hyphomicrobium sp.]